MLRCPLLIQPLHMITNRAPRRRNRRRQNLCDPCQQHQRGFPGDQLFCDAGEAVKQHHAIVMLRRSSMPRCSITSRRELTFHHNRVVAPFVKPQYGLNCEVFRQRIKASDDNSDHLSLLSPSHGRSGTGETVLIHHRFTHAHSGYVRLRCFHVKARGKRLIPLRSGGRCF